VVFSYSTFDDFYRPSKNERKFSYTYCGIRGYQKSTVKKTKACEEINAKRKKKGSQWHTNP
jgi:hypothetical protein